MGTIKEELMDNNFFRQYIKKHQLLIGLLLTLILIALSTMVIDDIHIVGTNGIVIELTQSPPGVRQYISIGSVDYTHMVDIVEFPHSKMDQYGAMRVYIQGKNELYITKRIRMRFFRTWTVSKNE